VHDNTTLLHISCKAEHGSNKYPPASPRHASYIYTGTRRDPDADTEGRWFESLICIIIQKGRQGKGRGQVKGQNQFRVQEVQSGRQVRDQASQNGQAVQKQGSKPGGTAKRE
jgi:hypothetical protein